MPQEASFVFLECSGPAGRTSQPAKQLRNRHAQLALHSKTASKSRDVLPVQIRYRVGNEQHDGTTSDNFALDNVLSSSPTICSTCSRSIQTPPAARCGRLKSRSHNAQRLICRHCRIRLSGVTGTTPASTADQDDRITSIGASILTAPSTFAGDSLRPAEVRAMGYFRVHASTDLSGFQPGRFWSHFTLQVSHTEPLVRQAVVAISSAHLKHCAYDQCFSATTPTESISAYTSAIQSVRKYMNSHPSPSYELILLCCVLFFVISRISGDYQAAETHLRNGVAILSNIRRAKMFGAGGTHDQEMLDRLTTMFVEIDAERLMQNLEVSPCMDLSVDHMKPPPEIERWDLYPQPVSPHDTAKAWMYISHEMWCFVSANARYRHRPLNEVPENIVIEWLSLKARIKAWRRAIETYVTTHPVIVSATSPVKYRRRFGVSHVTDAICALVSHSHGIVCKRFLAEALRDESNLRPWDRNPEQLLRNQETIITLRRMYSEASDVKLAKTFSTHVGASECLMTLAHRTSSPSIRARAQNLVRQFKEVQHGLTGLAAFFSGYGAPPSDFILIYEVPGH